MFNSPSALMRGYGPSQCNEITPLTTGRKQAASTLNIPMSESSGQLF
jgi:hypothetical protein